MSDPELSGTAYPVQRTQGIEVAAPQRTVSQKTLRRSVYPIWPSVVPTRSTRSTAAIGDPSSLLTAVAGGEDGVLQRRLFRCARGVARRPGRHGVHGGTRGHVGARVGSFTDLSCNTFAIVTRGG